MESMIRASEDGVVVAVAVVPGARREAIVGPHGGRIKVRVSAPPERGKANEAVVDLLVRATGADSGEVISGHGHRFKSVRLHGIEPEEANRALDAR